MDQPARSNAARHRTYDAFSSRLLSVAEGSNVRSFGYAADGSVIADDRGADASTSATTRTTG